MRSAHQAKLPVMGIMSASGLPDTHGSRRPGGMSPASRTRRPAGDAPCRAPAHPCTADRTPHARPGVARRDPTGSPGASPRACGATRTTSRKSRGPIPTLASARTTPPQHRTAPVAPRADISRRARTARARGRAPVPGVDSGSAPPPHDDSGTLERHPHQHACRPRSIAIPTSEISACAPHAAQHGPGDQAADGQERNSVARTVGGPARRRITPA